MADLLISYEDKFNIFVIGGGGLMIAYEYKTYKLMVLPHSTWVDTGGDDDDDDDDDDCKCGAASGLDGICWIMDGLINVYII